MSDCLLGVHDGPKIATLGDQLVNGAGVSRRQRRQSTISQFTLVDTDVVDNGRVLRTVFQMVRSGQFGRSSLSSSLQRAFQRWLNEASVGKLLSASIGSDPSLRDVLRMARPTPKDNARRALFGWLTGKETEKWAPAIEADPPEQVQALAAYRRAETAELQALIIGDLSVRWDLLADAASGTKNGSPSGTKISVSRASCETDFRS
jgi:hypothetical protein